MTSGRVRETRVRWCFTRGGKVRGQWRISKPEIRRPNSLSVQAPDFRIRYWKLAAGGRGTPDGVLPGIPELVHRSRFSGLIGRCGTETGQIIPIVRQEAGFGQ
jgi:hypothetical protein